MTAQRIRVIIAAVAAIVVIGVIAGLALYASSLRPYKDITPYSSNYGSIIRSINADAGVFRERDHYVSISSDLTTPSNGLLLINPIELGDQEFSLPLVQRTQSTIENTITSRIYTRLTNSKRSEERAGKAPDVALVSLDFNNALQNSSWTSLTIYNNENAEELVDSTLLFAPANTQSAISWSNNASLFLIDGAITNRAAAILPGVNILNDTDAQGLANGVIYSNRPLAIGGLPSQLQDRAALEAIVDSINRGELLDSEVLSVDISQRITGTDLVFTAPEGKDIISSLRAPLSRSGLGNSLSIEGGVIAIDRGVTLVMGSGNISSPNPLIERGSELSTLGQELYTEGKLVVSPRSLVVDGGNLILSDTNKDMLVINSDIQVRGGGTLQIGNNVVINGNIYVFGGSTIEILGNFELNGNAVDVAHGAQIGSNAGVSKILAEGTKKIPGGIFIFANTTLQADGTPLGAGLFEANLLWLIDGSDGVYPIIYSRAVHFLSIEGSQGYPLMYNDFSCMGAGRASNVCPHFGEGTSVEAPEVRVGFSEDMATIRLFVSGE